MSTVSQRDRISPGLIWTSLVLISLLSLWVIAKGTLFDSREMIDFGDYYFAAEAVSQGKSPYRGEYEASRRYVYPQGFAMALQPLLYFSRETASKIWWYTSFIAYIAGVLFLTRWSLKRYTIDFRSLSSAPEALLPCLIVSFALGFSPTWFGHRLGQTDIFLFFILAAFILIDPQKHKVIAGGLLGISIIMKMSPLLILPPLILVLGWQFLLGVLSVLGVYTLVLIFGGYGDEEVYYLTEQISYHKYRIGFASNSVYHLFAFKLFGKYNILTDGYYGNWMTTGIQFLILLCYAIVGLWMKWKKASWILMLSCGVAFAHLASPFLEPHHATNSVAVLIPLFCLTLSRGLWLGFSLIAGSFLIGMAQLPLMEAFGGEWMQYLTLLTDLFLITVVIISTTRGIDLEETSDFRHSCKDVE